MEAIPVEPAIASALGILFLVCIGMFAFAAAIRLWVAITGRCANCFQQGHDAERCPNSW